MKLLMVSDAGNIHTKRWASALSAAGLDVVLFSITPVNDDFYQKHGVELHVHDLFAYKTGSRADILASVPAHIKAVKKLQKLIKKVKPDILHAHYATSYGLIAAMSGFHPLIVSVWGSDVYEFPRLSKINRMSVEFTLAKADRVLSTSVAMAEETGKYYRGEIGITPFGVDCEEFAPSADSFAGEAASAAGAGAGTDVASAAADGTASEAAGARADYFRGFPSIARPGEFVFGTVKTLSHKYGIDLLLKAFAKFAPGRENVRLVIAGEGPDRQALEDLAANLGISDKTNFLGRVAHNSVPALYSRFGAAVFLSREESFGVSVVEAMACGCPVIASDTPGFSEVLATGLLVPRNDVDAAAPGLLVPRNDVDAAAKAMDKLFGDNSLRQHLAAAGRAHVLKKYQWRDNVATMIAEYNKLLSHKDLRR